MNTKRLGNLDWLEALSYDSPFERGQDPFGRGQGFLQGRRLGPLAGMLSTGRCHGQAPFKGLRLLSLTELIPCSGSFLPGRLAFHSI